MTPQIAVAGIAFDDRGRVLLIERGRPPGVGLWSVPGGRLEFGETLRECCARELREETGLQVEVGPMVEVLERILPGGGDVQFHYVILDFLVTVTGGVLTPADDVVDARWCTEADLDVLPLTSGLRPVLARALAMAGKPSTLRE